MDKTNASLFNEFGPVSKQEWIDKAIFDLKGADFDKKLEWKNLSGINIKPFYNTEDSQTILNNTGTNTASLVNYRKITVTSDSQGNEAALKAIEEGMTGIIFEIKGNITPKALLQEVYLNNISVSFILEENEVEFVGNLFNFAREIDLDSAALKGYIDLKVMDSYLTTGVLSIEKLDAQAKIIKLANAYPNFKALTVGGTVYLDSGANQVQEVAYTLNSLVYLIDQMTERQVVVQNLFNNLHFQFAIGLEYFIEIGKFRAFNHLLHEIAGKYDITEFTHTVTGKTSIWSKSITDANTNMLRATTEAMAAILGNADGVLIDTYDNEYKETSDFSNRIAGNIATILKEESYFGKVANPVDGSYYIEEVTSKIAAKALELFKGIEADGGFYTAFENETIQGQIGELRLKKIKLISQRRTPMVGINKYPNLMETVAADLLSDHPSTLNVNAKVLTPRRASLEVEALRKVTEKFVEKTNVRPIVALSSFGHLAMRKARAAFAYDFMGVSGFNVLDEKSYESAAIAAKESAESDAHVVVICSSDKDYDQDAVAFVKAFRAISTDKVLLLAGAPTEQLTALTEAGLNGCINMRSDVIQTISSVQKNINVSLKSLEI